MSLRGIMEWRMGLGEGDSDMDDYAIMIAQYTSLRYHEVDNAL